MEQKRECSKCGNPFKVPDGAAPIVDAANKALEGRGGVLCPTCFKIWYNQQPVPEDTFVLQRHSKYIFTDDMGGISGFGGGYEQTCRNMLAAGLDWLDEHPNTEPKFCGFKGIYGIIKEDNEDAEVLSEAVVTAADDDCTGAMYQAVISSCLFIRKHSWEHYCEKMRKPAVADSPTKEPK